MQKIYYFCGVKWFNALSLKWNVISINYQRTDNMKKIFIYAMLLAAGTLALNSCNDKKDEPEAEEQEQTKQNQNQDIFKGAKFVCDYVDANNNYARLYYYIGQKNDVEWAGECYADEARKNRLARNVDWGTYLLNTAESKVTFTYTDGVVIEYAADTLSKGPLHKEPETLTYSYSDGVLTLTDKNGTTMKYNKQ